MFSGLRSVWVRWFSCRTVHQQTKIVTIIILAQIQQVLAKYLLNYVFSISVQSCRNRLDLAIEQPLFCSVLQPSSISGLATPWTYSTFPILSLSFRSILSVHILMLSIQAVRGLPCPACTWRCSLHYLFLQATSWCDHIMEKVRPWCGFH